jgi:hypothetical protein
MSGIFILNYPPPKFFIISHINYGITPVDIFQVEVLYTPAVPPKKNRKHPWKYDKELYKRRNEVGRMFRRLKAFRRTAARYGKLDLMFSSFIYLALCIIISSSLSFLCVNTP